MIAEVRSDISCSLSPIYLHFTTLMTSLIPPPPFNYIFYSVGIGKYINRGCTFILNNNLTQSFDFLLIVQAHYIKSIKVELKRYLRSKVRDISTGPASSALLIRIIVLIISNQFVMLVGVHYITQVELFIPPSLFRTSYFPNISIFTWNLFENK